MFTSPVLAQILTDVLIRRGGMDVVLFLCVYVEGALFCVCFPLTTLDTQGSLDYPQEGEVEPRSGW